ncbi:hypothetical protein FBY06_12045 [Pseudomonas sp. SJZ085]|nr:hypothetical protein FBX99_12052 [Pseudomonas sp. SJZ074]TWC18049.1 hypothetical protein FBY00_108165 [Pseudomonas sp. SJZ075]TWC34325.1 hypothetical protein FBY02_107165 [Pseudomonas sp. SJZ078]TWC34497.1 hypothetical protein FBY06_12045 [Pseudomonas sp. SJZ085]TWC55214.1 hypothetical protein FBY11_108165 [Pseudomonas sp. SJZ124]TWC90717.1 hypothetical protein FBY09_108165 [Pseudomonas sp. SJZ101]
MSRSLGLREDRRERARLVALIAGLFPLDLCRPLREQARSHRPGSDPVGAGLPAKRPAQSIQT